MHMGKDTPTSSPLIWGPPLIDMEDLDPKTSPNSALDKIADDKNVDSQEGDRTDDNNENRLFASPSTTLQRILADSSPMSVINKDWPEISDTQGAEGALQFNQQFSTPCEDNMRSKLDSLTGGETEADCSSSRVELSIVLTVEKQFLNSFKKEHLTNTFALLEQADPQNTLPEVLTDSTANMPESDSGPPLTALSTLLACPGISHHNEVNVQSREHSTDSFAKSSKSTAGPSDDIIPRQILSGEHTNKAETTWNTNIPVTPENPSDTSASHMVQITTPPGNFTLIQSHSASDLSIQDQETPIIMSSLALSGQTLPSLEKTGTGSVADHYGIPSSSPPTETESSSYFTPATIFRAHNPDFRTDVVGIQELVNSSLPSSPSMASNYLPSSSPVPPNSSPMDRINQTPPTSPTAPLEGYMHVGAPENYYGGESFPAYPLYGTVDHTQYQPLDPQGSANFYAMTASHQHLESGAEPHVHHSPYEQSFYNQPMDAPSIHNSYPQETITLAAPIPQHPTHPTIERTIELALDESESSSSDLKPRPTSRKNPAPNPKRTTLAGVKLQQKKLSRPFRSPVVHPPVRLAPKPPTTSSEPLVSSANSVHLKETSGIAIKPAATVASSSSQPVDTKIKHRTARAGAQFKSPLTSTAAVNSDEAALVRLTPTIQSLERKLQLLRRALKVREDVEEEALEGLASKWTEAGREAAWEVWDAVKDNTSGEGSSGTSDKKGKKRAIEENWGWDESGDSKKTKTDEEKGGNWGWDVVPVLEHEGDGEHAEAEEEVVSESQQEDDGNEETGQPTIGTMLLQLGIAPETLGWNEEEGTFVDRQQ